MYETMDLKKFSMRFVDDELNKKKIRKKHLVLVLFLVGILWAFLSNIW